MGWLRCHSKFDTAGYYRLMAQIKVLDNFVDFLEEGPCQCEMRGQWALKMISKLNISDRCGTRSASIS